MATTAGRSPRPTEGGVRRPRPTSAYAKALALGRVAATWMDHVGNVPGSGPMKVTAAEIADLLASAPPRKVPAHIAAAAKGNRSLALFLLLGLAFGGMGVLFTVIFFPW